MRGLSLENIIAACHGDYFGDMDLLRREVSAITTDSRKVEQDCLFAAIAGERVDGHDFIPAVMNAGALCAIGEKLPEEGVRPFIRVRNTVEALQLIAEFYRTRFDIPFIGISGSVGKTTAKEMVARRALSLLETGRSIFLDSGTTVLRLAEAMPDQRITVTTTGLNVAIELMKKDLPIVNIVGGMINRDNITVSGNQALSFLESINIDIAFIVPSGVSAKDGLTCGNYIDCELKKLVVEKARKVVLLMDSSKLNKSLHYTFCSLDAIDCIVTDEELPYDITERAKQAGITILLA